jgi:hypothetical protein
MANSTPVRKACLQCGKEFMARYQWSQKRHQRFCSLRCHKLTTKYTKEQVIAAFWTYIDKNGKNGCWLWTGGTYYYGYGAFQWHDGKKRGANRVAWELTRGPIPKGMEVLHACDVTACCNPDHLFLGTKSDNMIDMRRKGRHPNDRFKADDVRAIRAALASGAKQKDLAEKYKCNAALISMIKTGKNYAWVK